MRLGGNIADSEALLKKILLSQTQWQLSPQGVAFTTQIDELEHFQRRVFARVEKALAAKNPLLAELELARHRDVLEKTASREALQAKAQVRGAGLEFCREAGAALKTHEYYTAAWLKKTCRVWTYDLPPMRLVNSVALFDSVRILDRSLLREPRKGRAC